MPNVEVSGRHNLPTPLPPAPPPRSAGVKRVQSLSPRTLSLLKSHKASLFSALDLTMEYDQNLTPFHTNLAAAAVLAEAKLKLGIANLLDRILGGKSNGTGMVQGHAGVREMLQRVQVRQLRRCSLPSFR